MCNLTLTLSATTVFNAQHTNSTSLTYNVTPISEVKIENLNPSLISENDVNDLDSISDNLSRLSQSSLNIFKINVRNNTRNGFKLSVTPLHGVFKVQSSNNNDFGNHGEDDIEYTLSINHGGNFNANTIITVDNITPSASSNEFLIAKMVDLKSIVNYESVISINFSEESMNFFKMAGAYSESFTLMYTDHFGSIIDN